MCQCWGTPLFRSLDSDRHPHPLGAADVWVRGQPHDAAGEAWLPLARGPGCFVSGSEAQSGPILEQMLGVKNVGWQSGDEWTEREREEWDRWIVVG